VTTLSAGGRQKTRYCIRCGQPFEAAVVGAVLCPACGGSPIEREPFVTLTDTAKNAGATRFETSSGAGTLQERPPADQAADDRSGQQGFGWQVGDVILDTYEINRIFTSGGMGNVYKAHHRAWNIDLAIKSPNARSLARVGGVADFIAEAETWVDLGLHPHIVTCYYARTLDDVPHVFAEFVEGGSLLDWIRDGRLYAGDDTQALDRLLDVAVQFAWGLGYAHEHHDGMIHQDVKPANVLLTLEGIAKVTDFGLVGASAVPAEEAPAGLLGTRLVRGTAMTPAYCSPEQADGTVLTRRTDIWSWGLSVLEMFSGRPFWATVPGAATGQLAPQALEHYVQEGPPVSGIPRMPSPLVKLLSHVFQLDPRARPHDMDIVVTRLLEIYELAVGREYPRRKPESVGLRADSLNNRALSLLDLNREDEALRTWEEALDIDPHHPETTYNLGLLLWRSGKRPDDLALVRELEAVTTTRRADWRGYAYLGRVHMERGDVAAAEMAFREAANLGAEDSDMSRDSAALVHTHPAVCVHTFRDHTDYVEDVAITADGLRAVSVGLDTSVRIWSVAQGTCRRTLQGHRAKLFAVAIDPSGRYALSGGWDAKVHVWDLLAGCSVRVLSGHTGHIRAVAFTHDGRFALSAAGTNPFRKGAVPDNTVRIWDLNSGRCVRILRGHATGVQDIAVTPDGEYLLSVSGAYERSGAIDNTLRIWHIARGTCVQVIEGHQGWIRSVAVSADGKYALTAGEDRSLRLWAIDSGACLQTLLGHRGRVTSVAFLPEGTRAISASWDATVRLWDLNTGRCLRTFEGHGKTISAVVAAPDGRHGLSACEDRTLKLWDFEGVGTSQSEWALSRPLAALRAAEAEARVRKEMDRAQSLLDEGRSATAGAVVEQTRQVPGYERDPDLLALWHQAGLSAGRRTGFRGAFVLHELEAEQFWFNKVAVFPDGKRALTGGGHADGQLRVWDLATGTCQRTLGSHDAIVSALAISRLGRIAVSAGEDHTLRVWDLTTGRCRRVIEDPETLVMPYHAALTPDNRYLVTGSLHGALGTDKAKTLRLWSLDAGRCVHAFNEHHSYVHSLVVTPDGRQVITGSDMEDDNRIRVWDLVEGRCLHVLEGHRAEVWGLAVTSDGRHLVSASADKTLRLWRLSDGHCLRAMEGHTDAV
jgi:WD40 repeat protein/serine/threonine protein kinase